MAHISETEFIEILRRDGKSPVVLVCEHAGHHIPNELNDLGLSNEARFSHIAWDPGAMSVARAMSKELDAVLVASLVSRLVFDCNRPADATDAMPAQSEAFDVPGNVGLNPAVKQLRVQTYYEPFRAALATQIAQKSAPVIVTIHSFTPVYNGKARDVEIGILHDSDSRLADAILAVAEDKVVRRNEPYGPADKVTHTLRTHAIPNRHLNVMIEIRNDLIRTERSQDAMAHRLTSWVSKALEALGVDACKA